MRVPFPSITRFSGWVSGSPPWVGVTRVRLAVIGGGITGLAAAYEAERLGGGDVEVTLYEASDRLGGKMHTVRDDGFVVEAGADAVVRYKPWALELAREVGLAGEIVGTLPAEPAALIIARGRALPLPAGLNLVAPARLGPLVRTPLLSARGKLRALGDLVLPRGPGGDEPLGRFVSRRLGRELLENLAAPLVGGIYGGDPAELSTEAAFPQLLDLERRHRSLVLGSRRLLAERAASPYGGGLFASFEGGLGRLTEAITGALAHTEIRLGSPVASLEELGAGAVVLAVPAWVAADLVASGAESLRAIRYADAVNVTLAFPAAGFPETTGHGALFAAGERTAVRGFTWIDRKWGGRAPEGFRLVRAFMASNDSDEELVVAVLGELRRLLGSAPEPARRWVFRWPRAMPQYTVGHLARVQAAESALPPGAFLAGAAYRGVGVPDAVRSGREAAARALEFLRGR